MSECEECDDVLDEGFSIITTLEKARTAIFFGLGKQTELTREMKGFALGHISAAIEHTEEPATIARYALIKDKLDTQPLGAVGLLDIEIRAERKKLRDAFATCITRCLPPRPKR